MPVKMEKDSNKNNFDRDRIKSQNALKNESADVKITNNAEDKLKESNKDKLTDYTEVEPIDSSDDKPIGDSESKVTDTELEDATETDVMDNSEELADISDIQLMDKEINDILKSINKEEPQNDSFDTSEFELKKGEPKNQDVDESGTRSFEDLIEKIKNEKKIAYNEEVDFKSQKIERQTDFVKPALAQEQNRRGVKDKLKSFFVIDETTAQNDESDAWRINEDELYDNSLRAVIGRGINKLWDENKKDNSFEEVQKKLSEVTNKTKKFLTGVNQKSNDETEEIIEYNNPKIAGEIRADIFKNTKKLYLRTIFTFVILLFNVFIITFSRFNIIPDIYFLFAKSAVLYEGLNLGLLILCAFLCRETILNGLYRILSFKGNSDTAVAFATVVCLIQNILALIFLKFFAASGFSTYGVLAILALFLNSFGKLMIIKRVYLNFKFVSSKSKKCAVKIMNDEKFLSDGLSRKGLQNPVVAYQKKTNFLTDFLKLSYKPDPGEKISGKVAPFGMIFSLFMFFINLGSSKNFIEAISTLALVSCVCIPMACIPATNYTLLKLCKKALSKGVMITGYPTVRRFADTNTVMIDAADLYPKGSVVLHGIKIFGKQPIDHVVRTAVSLLRELNSPIAKAFDDVIKDKKDILYKPDEYKYIDNMGIDGYVQGKHILIGNRKLLENNRIFAPSRQLEEKYYKKNKKVMYIAFDNELCAMLLISYKPKDDIVYQMQRLEDNGVGFLIKTCDPNITAQMISENFRLFFRSVKILKHDDFEDMIDSVNRTEEKSRAYFATTGNMTSFAKFLLSCIRVKGNLVSSVVLQMVTVALGVSLSLLLSFNCWVNEVKPLEILIYTLFWSLAAIIIPFARKLH